MDFYKRIEQVCARIPCGRVATYGQLALLCGRPRCARLAGFALGHRLSGAQVPAHRVVNAQGRLSGADSFVLPGLQRRLLEQEGVRLDDTGRVNLQQYGWKTDDDTVRRLQQLFEQLHI